MPITGEGLNLRLTRRLTLRLTLRLNLRLTLRLNLWLTLRLNLRQTLRLNLRQTLRLNLWLTLRLNLRLTLRLELRLTLGLNLRLTLRLELWLTLRCVVATASTAMSAACVPATMTSAISLSSDGDAETQGEKRNCESHAVSLSRKKSVRLSVLPKRAALIPGDTARGAALDNFEGDRLTLERRKKINHSMKTPELVLFENVLRNSPLRAASVYVNQHQTQVRGPLRRVVE